MPFPAANDKAKTLVQQASDDFVVKLNGLLESLDNPDSTMPVYRLIAIHGILLQAAGFVEAEILAGFETTRKIQFERGIILPQVPRLDPEEIYAAYTAGFNGGIGEADKYQTEMRTVALKMLARGSGH